MAQSSTSEQSDRNELSDNDCILDGEITRWLSRNRRRHLSPQNKMPFSTLRFVMFRSLLRTFDFVQQCANWGHCKDKWIYLQEAFLGLTVGIFFVLTFKLLCLQLRFGACLLTVGAFSLTLGVFYLQLKLVYSI